MTPADLTQALLAASDRQTRLALLEEQRGGTDFAGYIASAEGLKAEADRVRLKNPNDALRVASVLADLAEWTAIPRCQALAVWARANALLHLGDYPECLRLYAEAARLLPLDQYRIDAARLTSNRATILSNLGRYPDALQAAQSAVAILQPDGASPYLASALMGRGVIHYMLGQYVLALNDYADSEDIHTAVDNRVELARLKINRANALEGLDRFEEAIALLREGRAGLAVLDHLLEVARADLNLGITYTRLGRYEEALTAFASAEAGFKSLDVPSEVAIVALYRADLYAEFNLYDELARQDNSDWSQFDEREMQWQAARARLHQAVAQRHLSDYMRSREALADCRTAFERLPDPVWTAITRLEEARLNCALEEWQEALQVAVEVADILARYEMPARSAEASLVAADCHIALGQPGAGAERFQAVLTLGQRDSIPALIYGAWHGLGRASEQAGRYEEARDNYLRAVDEIATQREKLRVEDFRSGFLDDKLNVFRDLVLLDLKLGRTEEAFAYVEQAKSAGLVDQILASLAAPEAGVVLPDGETLGRLNMLREELNWHQDHLEHRGNPDAQRAGAASDADTRKKIANIEREATQLSRKLQQTDPRYTFLTHRDLFSPAALHALLDHGDVFVQYFVAGDHVFAFVVDRDGLRACEALPITTGQIEDRARALEATLDKAASGAPESAGLLFTACARRLNALYEGLVASLEPYLAGKRRLIIAPDGVLFCVPFHALGASPMQECVIDRFEVAYTPSARVLQLCAESLRRRGARAWRPRTLVMGSTNAGALPHIATEVATVTRVLGALEGDVFLERDLSRDALFALAGQYDVLHFATHAVYRGDNPLFSALQLGGGAWLRAMDLCQLRLNGALVTLSACMTGRHRLMGGDLLGLSRGFLAAGAAALVVSLWPADDAATAILMDYFYVELRQGASVPAALRSAQRRLRDAEIVVNGKRLHPYAHPYFWAPFCTLGAPGAKLV